MEKHDRPTLSVDIKGLAPKIKLGQSLFIGFEGTYITQPLKEIIEGCHIGGVVLFSRNYSSPSQLRRLCLDLQEVAIRNPPHLPMNICIDHEGGRVYRLKEPFTRFPPALLLGKTADLDLVFNIALAAASELSAAGINTNLAPVLDLMTNKHNQVIADRSFGDDAALVSEMGSAYIRGLKTGGILSVAKHFPGHGDTTEDSHFVLPISGQSEEQLRVRELIPFRKAVVTGVDAIMTSHVLYPGVDGQYPATLSQIIIGEMLRKGCSFSGPVMSDDLLMGALSRLYSLPETAVLAYNAGVDILLLGHGEANGAIIHRTLVKAVEEGKINQERIDLATYNILRMKEKIRSLVPGRVEASALEVVGCPRHKELLLKVQ